MKRLLFTVLFAIIAVCIANAEDYKYVRLYNAEGQIIQQANYNEYISLSISEVPLIVGSMRIMVWGLYTPIGDDWKYTPGPNYSFYGTNNGWEIWVCTIGYHSEYIYVTQDRSVVRMTFMAGGNGRYKEYVRAKRPTIDRLAPTR